MLLQENNKILIIGRTIRFPSFHMLGLMDKPINYINSQIPKQKRIHFFYQLICKYKYPIS